MQQSADFDKFCEIYFSTTIIHLIHSLPQDKQESESHIMWVGRKDIFKSIQVQAHGTEDSL